MDRVTKLKDRPSSFNTKRLYAPLSLCFSFHESRRFLLKPDMFSYLPHPKRLYRLEFPDGNKAAIFHHGISK